MQILVFLREERALSHLLTNYNYISFHTPASKPYKQEKMEVERRGLHLLFKNYYHDHIQVNKANGVNGRHGHSYSVTPKPHLH